MVEVGRGVTKVKVGDLVAPDACQHCGECFACRMGRYNVCQKVAFTGLMADGAFAEYVTVPANTCYVLPKDFSPEAAALIEPLATGLKAVREAGTILGDTAVVFGAGTIGLGTLMCAKAAGAAKVIVVEMADARKKMAKKCGADVVLDPNECNVIEEIKKMTNGEGADVSFECIGNIHTAPMAVDAVHNVGKVIIVGIFEGPSSFNFFSLSGTDKRVIGTLAYTIDDFARVAKLITSGALKVEPLITGRIKIDDIVAKGFEELVNHKDNNIKILVTPELTSRRRGKDPPPAEFKPLPVGSSGRQITLRRVNMASATQEIAVQKAVPEVVKPFGLQLSSAMFVLACFSGHSGRQLRCLATVCRSESGQYGSSTPSHSTSTCSGES